MDRLAPQVGRTSGNQRMSQSLFHLLEKTAKQHPQREAVRFGGQACCYAKLYERSLQIAALLESLGAVPGERIAFCFRKSIDALCTMFAIIRTGATYVPLDSAWPAGRIGMICEDAGIRIWTGSEAPPAPAGITAAVVSKPAGTAIGLDSAGRFAALRGAAPAPARDIANILFTSGSTGRPKGVEITTGSLLHFSQWSAEYFGLGPDDRISNHAPYNFDLSTFDIFAAVRVGASMCPVPENLRMFPWQMAKFIAGEKVSVWYSVPSALVMMQVRGRLGDHDFSALRHIIFAGEVMPKPALQSLARELPHAEFTNLYGPTETNVCTVHGCTPADFADDGPVPIGRPISDTRVWIVDEHFRELPQGGAGELLVAGPTVTTGYHGDPAMSGERLVAAPDGDGRAYRTGDRVRRRDDSVLMFEGRIDRMIKCRGHRIEPGEIESALARHPAVREVAVVAMPDPVFGNRIRACLAPREGFTLDQAELLGFCREHLPAYMLPDEWAFFSDLPRTDREKVDLRKLAT